MLFVSQVDIFLVSGFVTIVVNYLSTWALLDTGEKKEYNIDKLSSELENKTHTQPIPFGLHIKL